MAITGVLAVSSSEEGASEKVTLDVLKVCERLFDQGHKFVLVPHRDVAVELDKVWYGRYIHDRVSTDRDMNVLYNAAKILFKERGCVQVLVVTDSVVYRNMLGELAAEHFTVLTEQVE